MNLLLNRSISLGDLRKPIENELEEFERFFKEAMRSNVGLIDLIARYIIRQKGKKVRPLLVLLSAKLCGEINASSYRAATLVEILHTATLVHDDVVDDADTRRGLASINAVWKNKVAVLMGDYLLSRGLLLSLDNKDYFFLHSTSNAVKRMSEGELLQIQKSRQLDNDEATYLQIIADKTASLSRRVQKSALPAPRRTLKSVISCANMATMSAWHFRSRMIYWTTLAARALSANRQVSILKKRNSHYRSFTRFNMLHPETRVRQSN